MQLFVSYARIDKPYCIQIVDVLNAHEVWYDQRLYAGQHWWKEILRRLDWSEGFVYLLSPESVTSEYCRREFELAKRLGRPIFPIMIRDVENLPADLAEMQYVNLSKGLNTDGVKELLNSILIAERNHKTRRSVSSVAPDATKEPISESVNVLQSAVDAMENGEFDQVVFLLKQAKATGFKSRFINIDAILAEAETALERRSYLLEAEREYNQISELLRASRTRRLGIEAFVAYRKDFPDYDPDKLADVYLNHKSSADAPPAPPTLPDAPPPAAPATTTVRIIEPPPAPPVVKEPVFKMPMLEWCDIPAGRIKLTHPEGKAAEWVNVQAFRISKYPVTNAQYQLFLDDPTGYANVGWWQFSTYAHTWRISKPKNTPAKFKGDERPRETVNWYDALAFCFWLGARMSLRVSLPKSAQWQRAFQGDDSRVYPWGNTFDKERCNTQESELKMTTLVNRYPLGVSPYGVYDMAGNVWEWCLDSRANCEVIDNAKRLVRGGSYISPYLRSHVGFLYDLDPASHYASISFRIVALG